MCYSSQIDNNMYKPLLESDIFGINFHKKQHFGYKNDVPMLLKTEDTKPSLVKKIYSPSVKYESDIGHAALQRRIPDWIAFNNQVLRFEAVPLDEQGLFLRGMQTTYKILYFLEDDTIQVMENNFKKDPRFRGTILKRNKIPKPGAMVGQFTLDDLNIGREVKFYGRKYKIYKCDQYTRDYLTELGIPVPENDDEQFAVQVYSRNIKERPISCPKDRPRSHPFKQFLQYDGNILQFYCVWVNKEMTVNGLKKFLLLYYLADDTIEIRFRKDEPVIAPDLNNGLQQTKGELSKSKIFVRRCKIPKERPIEPLPGLKLNSGITENGCHEFYTDQDLQIGSTINAWGRQLLIYDCDDLTKTFLTVKYGLDAKGIKLEEVFPDLKTQYKFPVTKPKEIRAITSQYRQPMAKHDFVKFMTRDRSGSQSRILRFLAILCAPGNADRQFIISYYLMDDTLAIYEKPRRNSGFKGGKFMDRCRVMKNNMDPDKYVLASDLVVGNKICLNGHWFQILGADEYALNYMEKHRDEFPNSNRLSVLRRLKIAINDRVQELKKSFSDIDTDDSGLVPERVFRSILRQTFKDSGLSEHEILTLMRSYRVKLEKTDGNGVQPRITYAQHGTSPIFHLQTELKKEQFSDFLGLMQYLQQHDLAGTGFLKEDRALRMCLAYPLPAKKHLIAEGLKSFEDTSQGINYYEFVNAINWKSYPATNKLPPEQPFHGQLNVNYKQMLSDMEEFSG